MRFLLTFLFFYTSLTFLNATHNRAGEITYEQTGARTIKATILTYTKTSAAQTDRDSLEICWGDGTCEMVLRVNEDGEFIENDFTVNAYTGTHTYAALGTYKVSMSDPNRNGSILNVNSPNSDQIQFHLQSTLNVLPMNNGLTNQSPTLLVPPIDIGFIRQPFMHTPNAIDLDGDSIAYELVSPLMENDMPVPNYVQVDKIGEGDNNTYSFDEKTGLFVWNSPQIVGQYNIAIKVKAFRNGELIDMMIRDMQILIKPEENTPPLISIDMLSQDDLVKVKAGQSLDLRFLLFDAEDGQVDSAPQLSLTSEFIQNVAITQDAQLATLNGTLKWSPTEKDIRSRPYYLVIKATDSEGATSFRVIGIQVEPLLSTVVENFKDAGYQLYPNPTNSDSFLQVPEDKLNQPAILSIFDQLGRLIQTQNIDQLPSLVSLNTKELAKGTYLVQLISGRSSVSSSLIVH